MPDREKQPRSNGTALGQGLGSPSRPLGRLIREALGQGLGSPSRPLGRLIRDTMRAKLLQLCPTP